jgi:hypothetical protein
MITAKKDDDLRHEHGFRHTKPTQEGHAYAFERQIKNEPDKFLPFIKIMVKEPNIPAIFKQKAIDVLKELHKTKIIAADIILEIHQDYITAGNLEDFDKMQICWNLQAIDRTNQPINRVNIDILINFLAECALDIIAQLGILTEVIC